MYTITKADLVAEKLELGITNPDGDEIVINYPDIFTAANELGAFITDSTNIYVVQAVNFIQGLQNNLNIYQDALREAFNRRQQIENQLADQMEEAFAQTR